MSAVWKQPSLTGLEVLWRWVFGIPACLVCWNELLWVVRQAHVNVAALQSMTVFDPAGAAVTISEAVSAVLPPLLHVLKWLAPVLLVGWTLALSFGRMLVLRRLTGRLRARPVALLILNALRAVAFGASFGAWFWCIRKSGELAATTGREPDLVLYCALVIVSTLGLFLIWSVVSWIFSMAPLLSAIAGYGVGGSLHAALRLGPVRPKLIEINLVIGIVKIALLVLALALSACPLPFKSVATPEFMMEWYAFVGVLYLLASDYFHVVRIASYLEMWKTYESGVPV